MLKVNSEQGADPCFMPPVTKLLWVAKDEERKEMVAYEYLLKKREKTLGNRRLRVMCNLEDTRFRWWI
jgi:hypothetical protein